MTDLRICVCLIKVKIKRGLDYTIQVPTWKIIDSRELFNPARIRVTALNGGKIKCLTVKIVNLANTQALKVYQLYTA